MKKLALVIRAVLLLSLAGCGLPQNVKTQKSQALKIAQSIPLPNLGYESDTGHKIIHENIQITLDGYDRDNGEPLFTAHVFYRDSSRIASWGDTTFKTTLSF